MPSNLEKYSMVANAAAVSKSDSEDLPNAGLVYVGGTGNIACTTVGGDDVTFSGIPAGTILPVLIKRVKSTNTTATNMVALY